MDNVINDRIKVVNIFMRSNLWVKNIENFYIVIYTFRSFKKKQREAIEMHSFIPYQNQYILIIQKDKEQKSN